MCDKEASARPQGRLNLGIKTGIDWPYMSTCRQVGLLSIGKNCGVELSIGGPSTSGAP